jgi:hypothetical protein
MDVRDRRTRGRTLQADGAFERRALLGNHAMPRQWRQGPELALELGMNFTRERILR